MNSLRRAFDFLFEPPMYREELNEVLSYQARLARKNEPNPLLGEAGKPNAAVLTLRYDLHGPVRMTDVEIGTES